MRVNLTITGLQEAQAANRERIAMVQPGSAFGLLIKQITAFTHRQAVAMTHVDTGALRASHRMEISDVRGQVFVDPIAVNPRTGEVVADYAEIEHDRGGEHAFYTRARAATAVYMRPLIKQFGQQVAD